jgi:hypothetical protein
MEQPGACQRGAEKYEFAVACMTKPFHSPAELVPRLRPQIRCFGAASRRSLINLRIFFSGLEHGDLGERHSPKPTGALTPGKSQPYASAVAYNRLAFVTVKPRALGQPSSSSDAVEVLPELLLRDAEVAEIEVLPRRDQAGHANRWQGLSGRPIDGPLRTSACRGENAV